MFRLWRVAWDKGFVTCVLSMPLFALIFVFRLFKKLVIVPLFF